jgi:hypothetical protein
MSVSNGFIIDDMGTRTDINWSPFNIFKRNVTVNTSFNFSNIEDKIIIVILTNTTASNRTVTFPPMSNSGDIVTNLRANTTTVYMFGSASGEPFCITPIRSEAIYA